MDRIEQHANRMYNQHAYTQQKLEQKRQENVKKEKEEVKAMKKKKKANF